MQYSHFYNLLETHREAELLKLFGAERPSPFITQTALAFCLKRGLPQPVEHVPLLLKDMGEMCVCEK